MRTIVITGASRGLGLASSAHLYKQGWRIVAAMRSVDAGLERLRAATGASVDDPRLVGIKLDLGDSSSIAQAATGLDVVRELLSEAPHGHVVLSHADGAPVHA